MKRNPQVIAIDTGDNYLQANVNDVNNVIAQRVRDHYKGKSGWVVAWYKRQDPDDFWFGPISAEPLDWEDEWDEDPIMKYFIVKV